MKNKDLISLLLSYDTELEVTTSNKKGTFSDIQSVCLQEWKEDDKKHSSITLVLNGYDSEKTITDVDGSFIDSINKDMPYDWKLDKDDALKAKKAFDTDFKDLQKKYKEWFNNKYNKVSNESMVELFGNDKPLESRTINDLKLFVYENGWQDELDREEFNNRSFLLHFLYAKLDDKIKENLISDKEKLWNEITNCNKEKKCCSCNKKYTFRDLINVCDEDPMIENWMFFR